VCEENDEHGGLISTRSSWVITSSHAHQAKIAKVQKKPAKAPKTPKVRSLERMLGPDIFCIFGPQWIISKCVKYTLHIIIL
jgi:hypothetical protein